MKKQSAVLVVLAVLFFCSTSRANITNVCYDSDHDGAFVCTPCSLSTNANVVPVDIYGDQHSAPGHLILNVLTDSPDDPTLNVNNSIDNETDFAWTEFTVNLTMAVPFSLTNVTVGLPLDWHVISYDPAAINTTSNFLATVVYDTGGPIPNGGTIDFGYSVHFSGSPAYTITQEMIPVPEPGTLGLVGLSLLLFGRLVWHRRGVSRG
jgi:hypothetical protein